MPATEQTPEIKNDLTILNLSSSLYPKNYYKKCDWKTIPKYYQIGTVMDDPHDFYSRLTKKQRKQTICEQILADKDFKSHFDKKYREMKDKQQNLDKAKFRRRHKKKKTN
ncbi:deoxynucleotidyltransferase terminal-interacting protein 2-like [Gordionus sp. m RMFG-2023]|uniref:deoxynucleotidyltransferase terminal-interacting protein 2-like n=1 Tax=Gordionus sp. m RMFG-2023 TaxID=3053472 RepID=UPI0031FBBFF2